MEDWNNGRVKAWKAGMSKIPPVGDGITGVINISEVSVCSSDPMHLTAGESGREN